MNVNVVRTFLAAALVLTLGGAARAQDVTISFKGTLTDVQLSPVQGISYGTPFTGYFTYNLATPNQAIEPTAGSYQHLDARYGITVTIAGKTFRSSPASPLVYIQILNDYSFGDYGQDAFSISSQNNLGVDGHPVWHIYWQLVDTNQTALSSVALPSTAP